MVALDRAVSAWRRRPFTVVVPVLFVACALGACGAATPTTTSAPSTTTRPVATAVQTITSNWKTFFAGATPAAKKIALLENGASFAAVINAQAGSTMARGVTAKVASVILAASGASATVRYSLLIGGQPALSGQSGTAVLQNGSWTVGDASFCGLLALEQTTTPACPSATPTTT
jgi:hypothetical protein